LPLQDKKHRNLRAYPEAKKKSITAPFFLYPCSLLHFDTNALTVCGKFVGVHTLHRSNAIAEFSSLRNYQGIFKDIGTLMKI